MLGIKSSRTVSAGLATYFFLLLAYHFCLTKDRVSLKHSFKSNFSDVLSSRRQGSLSAVNEVQNQTPLLYYPPLSRNMLEKVPRIRQCTIILPGADYPHYERALKTHVRHGERWGYPTRVLRNFLVKNKFYNKPAYTIYLILKELAKPSGERAEWIL